MPHKFYFKKLILNFYLNKVFLQPIWQTFYNNDCQKHTGVQNRTGFMFD